MTYSDACADRDRLEAEAERAISRSSHYDVTALFVRAADAADRVLGLADGVDFSPAVVSAVWLRLKAGDAAAAVALADSWQDSPRLSEADRGRLASAAALGRRRLRAAVN